MAGLVIYLKPFLAPLWAVAADSGIQKETKTPIKTPRHLVHVKRILRAFFNEESAVLVLKFPYIEWKVMQVAMDTDASPYGIGG
eukprot:1551077-Amphidinium_carterae.1